jgi:thiol-disulfide isomerase/thioredoxin
VKKFLILAGLALLALPLAGIAAQRVVLVEISTGTWCQYCPGAAMGADDLEEAYPDGVAIIENHNGDVFANSGSNNRNSFYGITGYPTAVFDGAIKEVGGSTSQSKFPRYEQLYLQRAAVPSVVAINIERTYKSSTHTGTVKATLFNEGTTDITAKVHIVISELEIPYPWRGLPSCDFVSRDMRPDASGTEVTIKDGDSTIVSQNFNIDPTWPSTTNNASNFEIICFVQTLGSFPCEVYNAAKIPLVPNLSAQIKSTEIKSTDGKLHPGQTSQFLVTLLNNGEDAWTSMEGVLSTSDDKVTVTDSLGSWGPAEPGQEVANTDNTFKLKLKAGAPDGYLPLLNLNIVDDLGRSSELTGFQPFEPGVSEKNLQAFSLNLAGVVTGRTIAAINVPSAANGRLDLFDASGRLVKNFYSGHLSTGTNLLPLSLESFSTGTYFVKVKVGAETLVKKLVVMN